MRRVASFVFFLSGFAALVYQVAWQRMLGLFWGTDVHSTTIVVSVFMAGLGLGSLAGGHLADWVSSRGRLFWFAGAELAVALFALTSTWLLYDVLYLGLGSTGLSRVVSGLIVFGVLLWPTFLMGMSLPLLSRALAAGPVAAATSVLTLYGWNTLGAACGALSVGWVFLRRVDLATTIEIGALLNIVCAVVIAVWALGTHRDSARQSAGVARGPTTNPEALRLSVWIAMYALSGFIALSLEIVWFRVLGVFIKSNAFTFGTLLAVYLAGLGTGTLLVGRTRLVGLSPVRAFLLLQVAIPASAAVLLIALIAAVDRFRPLEFLWIYVAAFDPSMSGALFVTLFGLVPVALMGLPTVMMGMSFSFLHRAVQTDPGFVGRRVGWLQTANIAGATLGALVTGLIALHVLGSSGTLRGLVGLGGAFGLVAWATDKARARARWRYGVVAVSLAAVSYAVPRADVLWARLHGTIPAHAIVGEDRTGIALFKSNPEEPTTWVFSNGLGQSVLPYGDTHAALGALPVLTHPDPRRVAVIGLGSGDTLFSAGGRSGLTAIDSIEIIEPQLEALRRLASSRDYPGLRSLLRDDRIRHHFTDGRAFLLRQDAVYDVIVADALAADSAFAGNLFSIEYFELLRDRLRPNGLAVTWCPTDRVRDTVIKVFPHVVVVLDEIAIGSTRPIPLELSELRARLSNTFTRSYYKDGGVAIDALVTRYLSSPPQVFGPDFSRDSLTDVNRDLFPRDEFRVPINTAGSTTR